MLEDRLRQVCIQNFFWEFHWEAIWQITMPLQFTKSTDFCVPSISEVVRQTDSEGSDSTLVSTKVNVMIFF
jgi:hypothetical protein